jgi:hypothetical protein
MPYRGLLRLLATHVPPVFRGMVIAEIALAVSYAVFVYKISNCAGKSVLF